MRRIFVRVLGALALLGLLLVPLVASAHQTVSNSGYDIEYGWINEPVIINQPNAVVINITKHVDASASATVTSTSTLSTTAPADVDVSGLVIQASYGGQTKKLTLQPLGENTPGQFVAPMMPTVAGLYTLQLSGKIDGNDIQTIQVQPEEAQTADVVQFPSAANAVTGLTTRLDAAQSQASTAQTIGSVGIVLGLIGTGLGAYALMRKK
jgi:hypothetical protein